MNIEIIKIDRIQNNNYNPNEMNSEMMQKLKDSIKREGFIDPLKVKKIEDHYEIIDGEQRFRAIKELGFTEIPCFVFDKDRPSSILLTLNSNEIRGTHNLIKEARAIEELQRSWTLDQLESLTVHSKSELNDVLQLLKLPADIEEQVKKATENEIKEAPVIMNFIITRKEAEEIDRSIENAEKQGKNIVKVIKFAIDKSSV